MASEESCAGSGAGPRCDDCGTPARNTVFAAVTCPACGQSAEFAEPTVRGHVRAKGVHIAPCYDCQQLAFGFESEMFCPSCLRLRPDTDDRLRQWFEREGPGDGQDLPCLGCGEDDEVGWLVFPYDCPRCGFEGKIAPDDVPKEGGTVRCSSCRAEILVPAAVWCDKCGLNPRFQGIVELISGANRERYATLGARDRLALMARRLRRRH
jgi:transcription elongation factor Elf1